MAEGGDGCPGLPINKPHSLPRTGMSLPNWGLTFPTWDFLSSPKPFFSTKFPSIKTLVLMFVLYPRLSFYW